MTPRPPIRRTRRPDDVSLWRPTPPISGDGAPTPAARPLTPSRPGTPRPVPARRTFTIEGRAAPGLFVAGLARDARRASARSSSRSMSGGGIAGSLLLVAGLHRAIDRPGRRRGRPGDRATGPRRPAVRGPVAVPRVPRLASRSVGVLLIVRGSRSGCSGSPSTVRRASRVGAVAGGRLRRARPAARRRHRRADVGGDGHPAASTGGLGTWLRGAVWAIPVIVADAAVVAVHPAHASFPVTPVSPCRRPATRVASSLTARRRDPRADRRGALVPRRSRRRPGSGASGRARAIVRGGAVLRLRPRPDDLGGIAADEALGVAIVGLRGRGSRSRSRSAGCSCGAARSGRRSASTPRSTRSC